MTVLVLTSVVRLTGSPKVGTTVVLSNDALVLDAIPPVVRPIVPLTVPSLRKLTFRVALAMIDPAVPVLRMLASAATSTPVSIWLVRPTVVLIPFPTDVPKVDSKLVVVLLPPAAAMRAPVTRPALLIIAPPCAVARALPATSPLSVMITAAVPPTAVKVRRLDWPAEPKLELVVSSNPSERAASTLKEPNCPAVPLRPATVTLAAPRCVDTSTSPRTTPVAPMVSDVLVATLVKLDCEVPVLVELVGVLTVLPLPDELESETSERIENLLDALEPTVPLIVAEAAVPPCTLTSPKIVPPALTMRLASPPRVLAVD